MQEKHTFKTVVSHAEATGCCGGLPLATSEGFPLQRAVIACVEMALGETVDQWFDAAGRRGKPDATIIAQLAEQKFDVNAVDSSHYTALGYATHRGYADVISTLFKHGADMTRYSGEGTRPLWFACDSGRVAIAQLLIECGAKVNENTGWHDDHPTALHRASFKGHAEVVRLLLSAGADPAIRSQAGKTALDVAAKKNKAELAAAFNDFAESKLKAGWCTCVLSVSVA